MNGPKRHCQLNPVRPNPAFVVAAVEFIVFGVVFLWAVTTEAQRFDRAGPKARSAARHVKSANARFPASVAKRPRVSDPLPKRTPTRTGTIGVAPRAVRPGPQPTPARVPLLPDTRKRLLEQQPKRPILQPGRVTKPGAGTLPTRSPALQRVPVRMPRPDIGKHRIPAPAKLRFTDRYKAGQLQQLTTGKMGKKLKLAEQYRALQKGDVARRLELHKHVKNIAKVGGVHGVHHGRHVYYHGRISPHYARSCLRLHYYGPRYFAGLYWYPRWAPWVQWSWYYRCRPIWDPRPVWCRPIIYVACPVWVWYQPPVWVALPVVSCGTWVGVEPVVVAGQYDLQLLAIRFVDPGHPDEKLGPRYRVWFRNNGDRPITRPFNVMLFASNDEKLGSNLPQSGVQVTAIEPGDIQSVDIRLPIEVFSMGRDSQGNPAPFGTLHVLVDAHQEVAETSESNNGAAIPRGDVLPVDPAAFEVRPSRAAAGGEVLLAGEGFGPVPGQVLVQLAGLELEGEILGWHDLGVRLTLPNLPLAADTQAELIVVRGDGAAANPLRITITPP